MHLLKTIILAAGQGTRMKSESPKVLQSICGKPLIQYVLEVAHRIGSLKIYLVVGYKKEQVLGFVQHWLGQPSGRMGDLKSKIVPVIQKKILGTAEAVRSAQGYFRQYQGNVLILGGDAPIVEQKTLKKLIAFHHSRKADCTFLTAVVECPYGYGRVVRQEDGSISAILEEKDTQEKERQIQEINVGVYCFRSAPLFDLIKEIRLNTKKKEFYLTDIIELMGKNGLRIESVQTRQDWEGWGVNTYEDLASVDTVMRQKILKLWMRRGVKIVDPQTTFIDSDVYIGPGTTVRPFTVIENNVRIGKKCVVGPFSHLRPGTRIGARVEVGNYTEISRTQMGDDTLCKHFSFLGDAQVGQRVNIGAGVVTANFDGRKKNKTIINKDAFVGSDSILIAPVKIGQGAITGAGCVVTQGTVVPKKRVIKGVPGEISLKGVKG